MRRVATVLTAISMTALALVSAEAATLRVGIQDDPDALDPALSGTYTGRFVFAALCDKLVDISPDLKIVPQLAEAWEWARGRQVDHFYAAQERHLPRWHRVRCRGSEVQYRAHEDHAGFQAQGRAGADRERRCACAPTR